MVIAALAVRQAIAARPIATQSDVPARQLDHRGRGRPESDDLRAQAHAAATAVSRSDSAFGAPCSVRNIRRGHPPCDGHPDNPQAPQAQASSQAQQQAQSDLATLQHDDNFASDLRPLSSDAHQAGTDLAFAKSDAALGTDCYNGVNRPKLTPPPSKKTPPSSASIWSR